MKLAILMMMNFDITRKTVYIYTHSLKITKNVSSIDPYFQIYFRGKNDQKCVKIVKIAKIQISLLPMLQKTFGLNYVCKVSSKNVELSR